MSAPKDEETAEIGFPSQEAPEKPPASSHSGGWWRHRSSAGWRAVVEIRLAAVREDLARVPSEYHSSPEYANVEQAERDARRFVKPLLGTGERLMCWLSGSRIESARAAVRRAEDAQKRFRMHGARPHLDVEGLLQRAPA